MSSTRPRISSWSGVGVGLVVTGAARQAEGQRDGGTARI